MTKLYVIIEPSESSSADRGLGPIAGRVPIQAGWVPSLRQTTVLVLLLKKTYFLNLMND